ncbi:MAG: DNA mismatch repair protein MutS [Paludibacteraceae bacterium]|nr:DNA mismatch repair protein MutS [Paludibacteraceae bacterium]MBP9648013.1 DNA mismatch repair protein MutS [Paludibacteraceae bacterium]MBP9969976.1 DNA mismatch repair protein MutS [Paludibacteraceae bacterium]
MKQYNQVKAKHPDAVLLFRVGDFYETFSDDAIRASEILGITLTRRANGAASYVELAGFPHHALDTYLPKLVRAGLRVAICEQLEDPKTAKGIVKRGITELVTPGVSYNETTLNFKENTFVAAVHFEKSRVGVAFLDISTGEFLTAEGSSEYVDKLLTSFSPKEVLYERGKTSLFEQSFGTHFLSFTLEDWVFVSDTANERLQKQFQTKNLKGFGVVDLPLGIIASGAILHYLEFTNHLQTAHITHLRRIEEERFVWLDRFTIRNLELYQAMHDGGKSLLDVLDKTLTPMGARMLKRWLAFPLKNKAAIEHRLSIVSCFFKDKDIQQVLYQQLSLIGDLERLVSKIAVGRINPRELVQLKIALTAVETIKNSSTLVDNEALVSIAERLQSCTRMRDKIEQTIASDAPMLLHKGGVIKQGIHPELDEYRRLAYSGKDYLLQIQQRESEATNIPSLKISYNNVFGYYIEVRNTHKDKVPSNWIRKQTLVSAERYITEELKEYEEKIVGAEEKIAQIEGQLFNELVVSLCDYISALQLNASLIAELDCLLSFANVSANNSYIPPVITETDVLSIKQGRHPVIEKQLPIGESYIANDVYLDTNTQQIMMITGPNMAGKSALLRQTALIVLMAQIGCFIPAESAEIGIVDKIFTRVGASDNISMGESTFMVEMSEASSILNNVSPKSLILFDELGRGTSTYDGISIAWAIVEYLHEYPQAKAKTLFATHYHELNEMEKTFSRIKNFNVAVKEMDNKIIFMRKLVPGGTEHSFGIHVAKMAGMPKSVVKRSNEILAQLEKDNRKTGQPQKHIDTVAHQREGLQMSFFQLDDPVLIQIRDEIKNVDVNNLTPLQALNKLNEIKKIITGK